MAQQPTVIKFLLVFTQKRFSLFLDTSSSSLFLLATYYCSAWLVIIAGCVSPLTVRSGWNTFFQQKESNKSTRYFFVSKLKSQNYSGNVANICKKANRNLNRSQMNNFKMMLDFELKLFCLHSNEECISVLCITIETLFFMCKIDELRISWK